MALLFGIAKDLLHLLIVMDIGAGMILLALGFRENLVMIGHVPEWHGFFTLRRPLASSYSQEYLAHRRRTLLYGLAFLVTFGIGALLIGFDNLLFKSSGC